MSLTIKENAYDFLPAPEGLHIARCYAVVDLGKQFSKFYDKTLPKVLIGWELADTLMENGKPFIQYQRYTASLNEKSSLRRLLEGWRGRGFQPKELAGFSLKPLLGTTCYLTTKRVVHPGNPQCWSKVMSVCSLPALVQCPPAVNAPIYFDLDHYTESRYLAVPEGIRKQITITDLTPQPEPQNDGWDAKSQLEAQRVRDEELQSDVEL